MMNRIRSAKFAGWIGGYRSRGDIDEVRKLAWKGRLTLRRGAASPWTELDRPKSGSQDGRLAGGQDLRMSASNLRLSDSERALARVGTTVQHKYVIDRLLGIGGMAAVYAATHRNGHRVAIKFMLDHLIDDPGLRQLFTREAYVANQVGHPGAVPVLDDDVDLDGCHFLIMPLLEGETLRRRAERSQRRLPLMEVGAFMSDALDVLVSAHAKGIVHRDIKPDNLFLTAAGHVRVLDFGIARRLDGDGSATITGRPFGTPAFMPPEQAMGDRDAIGPHSDCWAVGATIFTLLSGELVHRADGAGPQLVAAATRTARSLGEVRPELSPALVQFVDKALAFDPVVRWSNAREMRGALGPAFEEALGTSFASAVMQVRAELTAELSPRSDDPRVKETAPLPISPRRLDARADGAIDPPAADPLGIGSARAVERVGWRNHVPTMRAAKQATTAPVPRGPAPPMTPRRVVAARSHTLQTRIFHCGDGIAVGQYGPLCFVIWRHCVTRAKFEKQAEGLAAVVRDHPREAGFLCIIEAGTKPPDSELRRASSDMVASHGRLLKCLCCTIEGDGFWAALTRSVIVGMAMLTGREPAMVFSTVAASLAWVAESLALDSVERAATFIENGRRQLDSR